LALQCADFGLELEYMMILRPAEMQDTSLLLTWRNDELTRQMSRSQETVGFEGHVAWLKTKLSDPSVYFMIAEENGIPVGTVRIDNGELNYTVSPEHRGCGIATAMLTLVKERFGPFRAEIKKENIASVRAAEKAGHVVVLL
jgi:RimJ/RimL family protein N-acetyltransferase